MIFDDMVALVHDHRRIGAYQGTLSLANVPLLYARRTVLGLVYETSNRSKGIRGKVDRWYVAADPSW